MGLYRVKAISDQNELKLFSREGDSQEAVALSLLDEGLTPLSVSESGGLLNELLHRQIKFGVGSSIRSSAIFCERMSAMTGAGLTLEQTLKVISKHGTQDDATALAKRLLPRIQRGLSLSAALASEPGLPLYLPGMVRASEVGGALASGLADAARYMEAQANTQSKLLNALTYPLIILVTVVAALVMVLVLVIPSFQPIFVGEEHNLPKITQIVLWLSDVTVNHFPKIAVVFWAGMLSVIFLLKYSRFKNTIQIYALSLKPVRLVEHIELSRVIGVMGMLFHSGVEVSEAVTLAANTTRSKRLKQSFLHVARKLREGASITAALEEVPSLPDDTRALIEVGEHSGQLSKITQRAAYLLEINTYDQIGRMVALATPLSIIILGAAVGLIVGGVMLGILSINQLALRS